MTDVGVGIIGCGNISAAYLKLGPLFKGMDIRAVADINMDSARARASEFGVRAETVDALLKSSDIDVVVNLTIPAVHYDVSHAILSAGKHVYSEKPLVLTLDEGQRLRDLAAAKNLRIGSAPDTFLGAAHQQGRALLDADSIGKIIGGTCHVMGHGMEGWHPNPDFFFQPGAGPVLDIGPYYITNLIQLIGPVKAVAAMSTTPFATRTIGSGARMGERVPVGTPTSIHALLEFHSGATVTLGTSWDVWAHRHGHMELYGTTGSLFLPDPNFFGGTLEKACETKEIVAVEPWDHPFGVANDEGRANYRGAGLADMVQALAEGRPHRCNGDLAIHAVDVMTGILKAGEDRRFVELSTTCARPAPLGADEAAALLV